MNGQTRKNLLLMAEQQLVGFKYAQNGYSLISLINSMGLSSEEWKRLKKYYPLNYMSAEDKSDIDKYFMIQQLNEQYH